MSYPDNVLAPGEHVIVHRHPHWKRLIWPVLVLFLATALAAFGSGYLNSTHWQQLAKNIFLTNERSLDRKAKATIGAVLGAVFYAGWIASAAHFQIAETDDRDGLLRCWSVAQQASLAQA